MTQYVVPLQHPPILDSLHVYVDGVLARRDIDWTLMDAPPRVRVLDAAMAKSQDKIDCRYAWFETENGGVTYPPNHSASPYYDAANPAHKADVFPQFDPFGTPCASAADLWVPYGWGPWWPRPNFATQPPAPSAKEDGGWIFTLASGGFGTNALSFTWTAPSLGAGVIHSDFGSWYAYGIDPNGCNASVNIQPRDHQSYVADGSVQTITAIATVASTRIYRVLFYAAYSGDNVQFDIGYNPFR